MEGAKGERERTAVVALQHAIAQAPGDNPLRKAGAEALLTQHGLTRQEAREALERHTGTSWRCVPTTNRARKGKAVPLRPFRA